MSEKLFTVHDSFDVPSRGAVIVGRATDAHTKIIAGSSYVLVTPNGKHHKVVAQGVERFTGCFSDIPQFGILLGDQISRADAENNSELWAE